MAYLRIIFINVLPPTRYWPACMSAACGETNVGLSLKLIMTGQMERFPQRWEAISLLILVLAHDCLDATPGHTP